MGLEQQVSAWMDRVRALPVGTRILTALVLVFSSTLGTLRFFHLLRVNTQVVSTALSYPYLVLVPGQVLWYPWTLVTAAFCETSWIEAMVTLLTVPFAAEYLEARWGAGELLQFSGVIVIVSNIIATFISFAMFVVFRVDQPLFGTQFHGLEALQTGFLVAFAQLIPQHEIQLFGSRFSIRVRELPMLYVGVSNVMCVLGYNSPFLLIQFGWLVSWFYLRFFQRNEMGTRGDFTESFAFVKWFPPFLQKPLGRVFDLVHSVASRLGLVPRASSYYTDLELNVGEDDLPAPVSSGRAEAERRRAMALEALDQRMAHAKKSSQEERNSPPKASFNLHSASEPTSTSPSSSKS
ncbi:hypothetical protein MPSI1_002351 [Malassezia psittaci]|uniref:DUF1751-domain-containing protein n=1 Tax=Malassezia psittaci TaxID=1821823 RepID=A0AAF0FFJ8_9BASI|nr:hypothetical protein MPSI1_002351 [Malassezia psittaci]